MRRLGPRRAMVAAFGTTVALVIGPLAAAQPTQPSSDQQGSSPSATNLRAIRRAMSSFRGEPGVDRVVRAALRNYRLDPERAADLSTAARLRGLIPTLQVSARRGQGRDLSLLDEERNRWSTDDELSVSASLAFRLDRLAFSPEEVPLLREERALEKERMELVSSVVKTYFERRRLQVEGALAYPGALERSLRIAELTALLDLFTDGAFSRMIARHEH